MSLIALYLTHFNVHKGYETVWWKSSHSNDHLKSNIEFKTMPSGAHSRSKDIICFVQQDHDRPVYGLCVFRQNSSSLNLTEVINNNNNNNNKNNITTGGVDRSKVKMYSLGVLVDGCDFNESDWKLKVFKDLWEYKDELDITLNQLIGIEGGFNINILNDRLGGLYEKWMNSNLNLTTSSILNPPNHFIQTKTKPTTLTAASSSTASSSHREIKPDHMIDSLIPMFNTLGPLTYTIWKLVLLKKRIIFYMDSNHIDNELLAKYIYCICLISSIPKESKFFNDKSLNYPLFNICITDIPQLKNYNGFIASTSDRIILEKPQLYDYSIKIPFNNDNQLPEIKTCLGDKVLASPRDLDKFKIIYHRLNSYPPSLKFDQLSSYKSLGEITWYVMGWWATAGDNLIIRRQTEVDLFFNDDNTIDRILNLLGYFQRLTLKLFNNIDELINDQTDNDVLNLQDVIELGLDPYNSNDCDFLLQLIKEWWDKDNITIGGYFPHCFC